MYTHSPEHRGIIEDIDTMVYMYKRITADQVSATVTCTQRDCGTKGHTHTDSHACAHMHKGTQVHLGDRNTCYFKHG